MTRIGKLSVSLALIAVLAGCGPQQASHLVDPFPLRFPLVQAGSLEIEGTVVGQPRARDGIVYLATREGFLTAVVVQVCSVFWTFRADNPLSTGPELGEGHVIIRDAANTLYVLDTKGSLVFKKNFEEAVTTAAREMGGRLFLGTDDGRILALDASKGGTRLWEYQAESLITAGPVFAGNVVVFGTGNGQLIALSNAGGLVWEFAADGPIAVDPAARNGRIFFGTESRSFYCLDAATGKQRWSRRLQGAPLHPPIVRGRRLAVAASNSVVYLLSSRGGSILSWEAVPSRIVHELCPAGPLLLVSSAAPNLFAIDFESGKRAGQHLASGPLAAGALWVSSFVVLFEEDSDSGQERFVLYKSEEGLSPSRR